MTLDLRRYALDNTCVRTEKRTNRHESLDRPLGLEFLLFYSLSLAVGFWFRDSYSSGAPGASARTLFVLLNGLCVRTEQ